MKAASYQVNIPLNAFLKCYHHLLNSPEDIEFLWGSRDSGKSRFVASKLIADCLGSPYFRCGLFRKVFNTIKESQWQTLKDVADYWKVQDLFDFHSSPLEIRCTNGNRFLARGFDEPGKIKSLSNVSHAWVEEGNQLTQDDFIVLLSTLRTNEGRVKTWFTFNPEADGAYEDYWLYKTFFADQANPYENFSNAWNIAIEENRTVPFTFQSTHTTYHDNPYCTAVRRAFLENLGKLDPYYYQVFTHGRWGNRQVGDPFCFAFDRDKHVRPVALRRDLELYLSFDFNVNPITCGVYQHTEDGAINCVEALKLFSSDIYKLCERIRASYPNQLYIVTGDATGRSTSALVLDGINYYTVIKEQLNLGTSQLKVPAVNPKISENRVLVNSVFRDCKVSFDPVGAKDLIFDCLNVSVDDLGQIEKGDRSNPKKRADHLDHFRYYLNTFHRGILRN